eukprot:403360984
MNYQNLDQQNTIQSFQHQEHQTQSTNRPAMAIDQERLQLTNYDLHNQDLNLPQSSASKYNQSLNSSNMIAQNTNHFGMTLMGNTMNFNNTNQLNQSGFSGTSPTGKLLPRHFNDLNQYGQEVPISFDENNQLAQHQTDNSYRRMNNSQHSQSQNRNNSNSGSQSRDSPTTYQYQNSNQIRSIRPSDQDQVIQSNHSKRTSNVLSSFLGSNSLNYSNIQGTTQNQQDYGFVNLNNQIQRPQTHLNTIQQQYRLEPVIEQIGQSESTSQKSQKDLNQNSNRLLQNEFQNNSYYQGGQGVGFAQNNYANRLLIQDEITIPQSQYDNQQNSFKEERFRQYEIRNSGQLGLSGSQNYRGIPGATDTLTTTSLGLGGSQDFQFKSRVMETELSDLRCKINQLEAKLNHHQLSPSSQQREDSITQAAQQSKIDYYADKFKVNTRLQSIDEVIPNSTSNISRSQNLIQMAQAQRTQNPQIQSYDQRNQHNNRTQISHHNQNHDLYHPTTQILNYSPDQQSNQESQKLIELNKVQQDESQDEKTVRKNLMDKLASLNHSQIQEKDEANIAQDNDNNHLDIPLKIEDMYKQIQKEKVKLSQNQNSKKIKPILRNKTTSLRRRENNHEKTLSNERNINNQSNRQTNNNNNINNSAIYETRIKPSTLNDKHSSRANTISLPRQKSQAYTMQSVHYEDDQGTHRSIEDKSQSYKSLRSNKNTKSKLQESKVFSSRHNVEGNNTRSKSRGQRSKTPKISKNSKVLKSHRQSRIEIQSTKATKPSNKTSQKLLGSQHQTQSTITNKDDQPKITRKNQKDPKLQKSTQDNNKENHTQSTTQQDQQQTSQMKKLEAKISKLKKKLKEKDAFIEEILEENEELIEQLAKNEKMQRKQQKQIVNQEKLLNVLTQSHGNDSSSFISEERQEQKIVNIKKKK